MALDKVTKPLDESARASAIKATLEEEAPLLRWSVQPDEHGFLIVANIMVGIIPVNASVHLVTERYLAGRWMAYVLGTVANTLAGLLIQKGGN